MLGRVIIATTCAVLGFGAFGTAGAQTSIQQFQELWSGPNEFYLFDYSDSQTFAFSSPRQVKVCASTTKPNKNLSIAAKEGGKPVGLQVQADEGAMMSVKPGDCREFQARSVEVSPADTIAPGWALRGTIETSEPSANS